MTRRLNIQMWFQPSLKPHSKRKFMLNSLMDILMRIVTSLTYLSELCIALNNRPANSIILFAPSLKDMDM